MNEPVLLNDFKRLWSDIETEAVSAFSRVGQSGWWILGREVENFEADLARFSRLQHAVGCGSGLDALEIGLRIQALPPGGKVLTTPLSAFASTLAIIRAGGVPLYVDVDEYGLMDLRQAEETLASNPDIKFMLPVHLYGHSLDLKKLECLKDTYELSIVEDCAQAIGSRSAGIAVGSIGQVAATSFYPTKNLGGIGDGGALLTNDQALAEAARSLRDYGQSSKYEHTRIGLNSRLDELQAAILQSALLPRLEGMILRRSEIAAYYMEGISNPNILCHGAPESSESVWHLFPILVKGDREAFERHLKNAGIMTGRHYPFTMPEQEALKRVVGMPEIPPLPRAEEFARSQVSLPIHPHLNQEELDRVLCAVNSWCP